MFRRSILGSMKLMFLEVDEVAAWLGKFLHLLKTTVILIFYFVRPYAITFTEWDYKYYAR